LVATFFILSKINHYNKNVNNSHKDFIVYFLNMEQITLKDLHEAWSANCTCELKHTAIQPVFGYGNPKSPIVFIGEAPGKDEDTQGVPFIGRAGKFLDEMLEIINMKREDIYITNMVKYRPPNNRDPLPEEKDACKAWLYEELNFIKPILIVFLGRHAMNNFFGELQISTAHGKLIHKKFTFIQTQYFLPLYHPASALYNPKLREILIADFKKNTKSTQAYTRTIVDRLSYFFSKTIAMNNGISFLALSSAILRGPFWLSLCDSHSSNLVTTKPALALTLNQY
jgi:uracil-DNA glycosylase family 4